MNADVALFALPIGTKNRESRTLVSVAQDNLADMRIFLRAGQGISMEVDKKSATKIGRVANSLVAALIPLYHQSASESK
ncbi:MAG: hypothetical protein ACKVU2_16710 [Saprospiraceae bacterium]